jgi:uncharacterized protein YdeI (YjbR/CyaY-like superfamily)
MKPSTPNPEANPFFARKSRWQAEYAILREIALASGLDESIKWMHPTYSLDGKNVFLIHGFKDYCALLFMKGSLLSDTKQLLIQQTENVQARRQLRFTSVQQIIDETSDIIAYISNAIDIEKAGIEPELKETADFYMPEELQDKLAEMPELQEAFERLTPGRQRGYLLYFAAAKQSKTRSARIEANIERILEGFGLND